MLVSLSLALLTSVAASPATADLVAVQAGTIHVVADGRVIEGGGTLLLSDGKILAVGATGEIQIPVGVRVVDYGPDAVIVPGFVAADSTFGRQQAADRTADAGIRAADNFDPYASYASTLAGGVTTAYLPPPRGRLIAGQGAVVKLAGEPGRSRFVSESAAIEGSISADARRTPGYWEPPIPATVDVGLGVEQKQLPRSTMGAIMALRELLALAKDSAPSEEYGPYVGPDLAPLIKAGRSWHMRGDTKGEIRALLGFFGENGLPLVLTGAAHAGELAEEIANSGFPVIWSVPVRPNNSPIDRGKGEDVDWPRLDVAAKLSAAGVRFAIAPPRIASRLRFAAEMAARGGLSSADALRAITLTPAELLGVADRVGSLAPGRDADLVVLSGPPLTASSGVVATWVDGDIAFKADESGATVVAVDELHVGDGQVIAPAELLILDGRIVEVGLRVSRPAGSTVVRAKAAMPGMIDARSHLGLEGSSKAPAPRFEMKRLIEPGDLADRRVALAGVTTAILTPRGTNSSGTPAMAYKPAAVDLERMVVADPVALAVQWSPAARPNRFKAGESVRALLAKGVDYKRKWDEYDEAMKTWTPPPPEPETKAEGDEKKSDEAKEGEDEKEADKKDSADDKAEEEGPKPLTGSWETQVTDPESGEEVRLRIRILDEGDGLEGTLRCNAISSELVELTGSKTEENVQLEGRGTRGRVQIEGVVKEVEQKKGKKKKGEEEEPPEPRRLEGKLTSGGVELEFVAAQVSEEYPVARRPERRKAPVVKVTEPKGKPKPPGITADLEPLRKALESKLAVVVEVYRSDEILACVKAFEEVGIRPILYGADEAWKVRDELRGRVAGILLGHQVTWSDAEMGVRVRNRYAELQNAGIPVAFQSSAEEGAADLPLIAAYAVSEGMSASGALRALTSDAADMFHIGERVGRLAVGRDADLLLLDGSPLDLGSGVVRVWVAGREIRLR